MVEAGTRVVEVIWPKVANSDNHSWDVHTGLTDRMKKQSAPMLDAGLSALIADLDERGMLDETLVVAVGEFGRSPQRGVSTSGNGNSDDGRDHWPYCYTACRRRRRHQARLRLRQVAMQTASAPLENPVHPIELLATIYHAVGINPQHDRLQPPQPAPRVGEGGSGDEDFRVGLKRDRAIDFCGTLTWDGAVLRPENLTEHGSVPLAPNARLQNRQRIAAFFERAAGDADAVAGAELAPNFFAGHAAGEQLAIEVERLAHIQPRIGEQFDAEVPHAMLQAARARLRPHFAARR